MAADDELREVLSSIRRKLRITKVVSTRAYKHRDGDSFAGFAAAWESIQDDAGGRGADVIGVLEDDDRIAAQGMTMFEARIAHLLVAMQADIAATEAAMAGGGIGPEVCQARVRMYKNNYAKLIRDLLSRGKNVGSSDDH